ncbi:unnamed protein product, partial [Lymnaea stagnalis]
PAFNQAQHDQPAFNQPQQDVPAFNRAHHDWPAEESTQSPEGSSTDRSDVANMAKTPDTTMVTSFSTTRTQEESETTALDGVGSSFDDVPGCFITLNHVLYEFDKTSVI